MAATQTGIDLFGSNLPSVADIEKLALYVNSSEKTKMVFSSELNNQPDKGNNIAAGIALFILGKTDEAIEKLEKAKDCQQKSFFLAYALRRAGRFDDAMASLDKAKGQQADMQKLALERATTLRHAEKFDEAAKELKGISSFEKISAEYHYQLARLQEAKGEYTGAMANYKTALEIDPSHQKGLFHLAYMCDLRGDEDAAMDYYKQVVSQSPVYVSALLNLAVLYEDLEEYEKAIKCVDKVLDAHPNHKRALLFEKDIENSKNMLFDEERERKLDKRNQILEIPISDFELSVRSRNCLRKMNIRTIGDLLRTTEAELLSYKNFGETSLAEIKGILGSKNLRLGMAVEDKAMMSSTNKPAADPAQADDNLMNKTVEEMEMSVRARKCLQKLDIHHVGELVSRSEAELLGCKNFGVTSLNEIKQRLTIMGLSLKKVD
ncbi:MAG: hypothetical protein A2178_04045 [Planctomycetes bacterium GWC2_49_10]|nr:MAG: hypothetical protein A2178_04045 [Planctomycetes bacterium GWC2_49_10]